MAYYFKNRQSEQGMKKRDRNTLLKEANKRIALNPKDPKALLTLADIYYKDNNMEKAFQTYRVLSDLCATNPELDEFDINLKYGIAAFKMNAMDVSYKALMFCWAKDHDNNELNSYLGRIEYKLKRYDKAAGLLRKVVSNAPGDIDSRKYLGMSFFKLHDAALAVPHLIKAAEHNINDKETLFTLGKCFNETGRADKALKIFTQLRSDPVWGPNSCLFAGTINSSLRNYEDAIMDFEVGLQQDSVPSDIALELLYRLGLVYIKTGKLPLAIEKLTKIRRLSPGYKDVSDLLNKYTELSTHKNLQLYMASQLKEFCEICKRLASQTFSKSSVKAVEIFTGNSQYIEILAEVKNRKWEDVILFRFMREEGMVGELVIRDLYGRLREVRAGRGFCFTCGEYSPSARDFVEARLIDLIDKEKLILLLKKLN